MNGWIELAAVRLGLNRPDDAMVCLRNAVQLRGEEARNIVRQDPRFQPLHNRVDFQQLLNSSMGPPIVLPGTLQPFLR
jgi:hypothetical protein